jgi:hypothetical protein
MAAVPIIDLRLKWHALAIFNDPIVASTKWTRRTHAVSIRHYAGSADFEEHTSNC